MVMGDGDGDGGTGINELKGLVFKLVTFKYFITFFYQLLLLWELKGWRNPYSFSKKLLFCFLISNFALLMVQCIIISRGSSFQPFTVPIPQLKLQPKVVYRTVATSRIC